MILTPLQKLTKNVEDLGKLIVAKCFEKLPNKYNKSPNLVTLIVMAEVPQIIKTKVHNILQTKVVGPIGRNKMST